MLSLVRRRLASRSLPGALRPYTAPPPPGLSDGEQAIYRKLADKFQPDDLRVQDVSRGCGTFYAISITSNSFKGLPTVKQHRLVNETLKQEIEGIHGLQLKTAAPKS
ncbi:bola-like protein [Panus rudis PR-1116 ss-1]|nr:bola-like protein [Panus rudis PR-1116 ss-1]